MKIIANIMVFTISNYYTGINIGSVSVNLVIIDDAESITSFKKAHQGRPREVLEELLAKHTSGKNNFYSITGSFGTIPETKAIERALQSYNEHFDAILSLGGEALVLYILDEQGYIQNVLSHDKCAAGSGEFFKQQIDRLGLSLPEAIELAAKGKKVDIASRCSVHCKSDITHKLNKGEASVEDLLNSVLASMVDKVIGLIIQSRTKIRKMLVIGGVSLNDVFIRLLQQELNEVAVLTKKESAVFEAFGAALLERDAPKTTEFTLKVTKSFATHQSLAKNENRVTILPIPKYTKKIDKKSKFILGVDVGSTTTKAVLIDSKDRKIVASFCQFF
jgi:activator of 2-hydroxyglutaryl-CoA dehydratase